MKAWLLAALVAASAAHAQHHSAHDAAGAPRPGYSGLQTRAIKALSEPQVADLRAGKGMALALPAELNGYPGPSHTLELAGALALDEEQKQRTEALFAGMQAEARRLGEEVIAGEQALDRLFRDRTASVATVQDATARAARAQGELRAAHLRYHLRMLEVLTPAQVARYKQLRGYE